MKLSQMINTKEEAKAENIEVKDGEEVKPEEKQSSEISTDDQAEMNALIAVGMPNMVTPEQAYKPEMDDATRAELDHIKSFAGI